MWLQKMIMMKSIWTHVFYKVKKKEHYIISSQVKWLLSKAQYVFIFCLCLPHCRWHLCTGRSWFTNRAGMIFKQCLNPRDSSCQMPRSNDYALPFVSPQSPTWRAKKILRPNKNLFNLFDEVCNKIMLIKIWTNYLCFFIKRIQRFGRPAVRKGDSVQLELIIYCQWSNRQFEALFNCRPLWRCARGWELDRWPLFRFKNKLVL